MSSVAEIEQLAQITFSDPQPDARARAQAQLEAITSEGADKEALNALFAQCNSPYGLLFTAQGAVTWFKKNHKYLSQQDKEAMIVGHCGGCLKRLVQNDAPRNLLSAMLNTFAKMTKITFEREPFVTAAPQFALDLLALSVEANQIGTPLYRLALLLLDTLVVEFSRHDSSRQQTFMNFASHRRCSNNFRDQCMLDIFKASVTELQRVTVSSYENATLSPCGKEVCEWVRDTLTFDFMAIIVDETEEALSAQFPSSWDSVLLSEYTQDVLWGQHRALPYPHCLTLLTGLSALCGIRRTFFKTGEERIEYLNRTLTMMVSDVQTSSDGRLRQPEYVTLFGEACTRFIGPFGYRDLHQSTTFSAWTQSVRAVSTDIFAIPFGREGSFTTATTLLNFWNRLTTSARLFSSPSLSSSEPEDSPKLLESIMPPLIYSFCQCRLSSQRGNGHDGASSSFEFGDSEDYSSCIEAVLAQCEAVASMTLIDHVTTLQHLEELVVRKIGPSLLNDPLVAGWFFYLSAGLVRVVLPHMEDPAIQAATSFLAFAVDCVNHRQVAAEQWSQQRGVAWSDFVEGAVLTLILQIQHTLTSSRLQSSLSQVVTSVFQSRAQLFQFILTNTGHNMVRSIRSNDDESLVSIMRMSIDCIGDACRDIPPDILSELSFDLPAVVDLPLAQSAKTYKLRTNLYQVLWPLTRKGGPYTIECLRRYLNPIQLCMQSTMSGAGDGRAQSPSYIAGWLRDLRGAAAALHHESEAYVDFVEWFCGEANYFYRVLSSPAAETPMVIISLLRFLLELVSSRSGRYSNLTSNHSVTGLLLFKHIAALIQQTVQTCITDEHVQAVSNGQFTNGVYEMMLKPLSLSMQCLRHCVRDPFVPFAAMWYYQDDTYDRTLLGLLRMISVFPNYLYKEYPKATGSVVDLLHIVTDEQTYHPLAQLSQSEMEVLISFAVNVAEDLDTPTGTLLHAMSFLSFIASLVKDVKANTTSPVPSPSLAGRSGTPVPPSPMQLPMLYNMPGAGGVTGTPGRGGHRSGGGEAGGLPRSLRQVRQTLATVIQPIPNLWPRLIAVAMNIITLQDRALSISCSVVYPIFETHPPFWFEFVESFVQTYPQHKHNAVREALSTLAKGADSQDRFFSEVFSFRQQLRAL